MRNNYLKSENYYFLITHFDATRSGGDGGEQQKNLFMSTNLWNEHLFDKHHTKNMQTC